MGPRVRPLDSFDITLSFQKVGEPLTVPFEAVKAFFDPSVQFMLQFKPAAAQPGAVRKPAEQPAAQPARLETKPEAAPAEGGDKPALTGGEVVSLDKFRKK
ncbi:MAG: ClpXP protease specificity-enhancing factor SspB [Alphaproteobacteria bacterium]